MALSSIKIKDVIKISDEKNIRDFDYAFFGININKEFMPSVANTSKVDRRKYKILRKKRFVFSGMQTGRDNCIRIGMYDNDTPVLVSPAYTTFEVTNPAILPEYFFMIFRSKEMDRYGAFLSDSSVRSNLDWDRFCDIELTVPPIEIQKKYVAIYEGMLVNLRILQKSIVDLKTISYGVLEGLKQKRFEKLGHFIKESNEKNINCSDLQIVGISKGQKLIASDSRTNGVDKKKYFVLHAGDFAYSPIHINEGSIALNSAKKDFIVSPIYKVFRIIDKTKLYPPFLMLLFSRTEFIRYCWFNAFGSARDSFGWNDLCALEIPVPSFSTQKLIASFFEMYSLKKQKIENLQDIISKSCPILIRGSNLEWEGKKNDGF